MQTSHWESWLPGHNISLYMLHEAKSLGTIPHKHTQSSDPEHSPGRQRKNTKKQRRERETGRGRSQNTREHLLLTLIYMGKMTRTVKCLTRRHYAFFNVSKTRKR